MTVSFLPVIPKTIGLEGFREVASSAHSEFITNYNNRTSCGTVCMPNHEVVRDAVIDKTMFDAIISYPPVKLVAEISNQLFDKPLFITGGICQLIMWGGLPVTISSKDSGKTYQFDDRCNRDVDMKTVLAPSEFQEMLDIVIPIYEDNKVDGWVVENKPAQNGSYPKLEFRQRVNGKELIRAQIFNIEPMQEEEDLTALGRYMHDNSTPYYQTAVMLSSEGATIADPNNWTQSLRHEFERNAPVVKFQEMFPVVTSLAVGDYGANALPPKDVYWAMKTAMIYMAQAKYIYGLGIIGLNPVLYRKLISLITNGEFGSEITPEESMDFNIRTWRASIEMMADTEIDYRDYSGSKHPIAEFFFGVPPLMQYLLPELTQKLLGNLIVQNINSLNYHQEFEQQSEGISEDELKTLLVQHKTAYIFTLGLHAYRNSFVDINQVIAWLLVSAYLASESIAIDGVVISNFPNQQVFDIGELLKGSNLYSCGPIDGMPQYVSVQNRDDFKGNEQHVDVITPKLHGTHGKIKTKTKEYEFQVNADFPSNPNVKNLISSEGVMLRKRFVGNVDSDEVNQKYRLALADITLPISGIFQDHMYSQFLQQSNYAFTEIPNVSSGNALGIDRLLVEPGNRFYIAINIVLATKSDNCGIIASI